jgi:hypothetical protein
MSHTVEVNLIADQLITFQGFDINIHNIETIILGSEGEIKEIVVRIKADCLSQV